MDRHAIVLLLCLGCSASSSSSPSSATEADPTGVGVDAVGGSSASGPSDAFDGSGVPDIIASFQIFDAATESTGDVCQGCPPEPLCEPGRVECWSGRAVKTCNLSGTAFCVEQCADGSTCVNGACCTPSCAGRECGFDGCSGVCGGCAEGTVCESSGQCVSPLCSVAGKGGWLRSATPVSAFHLYADGRTQGHDGRNLVTFGPDGLETGTVSLAPSDVYGSAGDMVVLTDGTRVMTWNQPESQVDKLSRPGLLVLDASDAVVVRTAWNLSQYRYAGTLVVSGDDFLVSGTWDDFSDGVFVPQRWLGRTDIGGVLQWQKTLSEGIGFTSAAPAPSGGVVVLGAYAGTNLAPGNISLAFFTADGTPGPTATWSPPAPTEARGITPAEGGFLVWGATWLARTDAFGEVLWSNVIAADVRGAAWSTGGVVVAGSQIVIDEPANGEDAYAAGGVTTRAWLRKLGADGATLWERHYGPMLTPQDFQQVRVDTSGWIYTAGLLRARVASDGTAPECP